ncbi:MAG: glycosyltransferase family 39 protein [Candidatus Omnitrophica bacterium]|nr:glycosyltransferase family 39 protein [Candidatus Omnitrophota bacterium]
MLKDIALIIPSGIIYLAFILPQITRVHTSDELCWLMNGIRCLSGKPVFAYSPWLYSWLISIPMRIWGINDISVRLIGIVSVYLSLFLIYLLIKQMYKNKRQVSLFILIANLLYVTHPMVIQGSLIVDIDNTIMTPAFLFLIYSLLRLGHWHRSKFILAILSTVIFLWTKLTAVFLFIGLATLVGYLTGKDEIRISLLFRVFFTGIVIFMLSWVVLSGIFGYSVKFTIDYTLRRLGVGLLHPLRDITVLFSNLTHLTVWFSPYLLLALFILLIRMNWMYLLKYYLGIGIISLLCYLVLTPLEQGFPKYYIPIVGFASILMADEIYSFISNLNPRRFLLIFLMAIVLVLYFYFVPGDIIYSLRYQLRKAFAMIGSNNGNIIICLTRQYVLYFLPLPIILFVFKYILKLKDRVFLLVLIFLGLAGNLALSIQQAKADYLTNYAYGERKTRELVEFLKERVSAKDKIVSASHILYYLDRYSDLIPVSAWSDKDLFFRITRDNDVGFLVYSITSNSLKSYKNIFNDAQIREYLKSNFREMQFGEHTVWIRADR